MTNDYFRTVFQKKLGREVLNWGGKTYYYDWLLQQIEYWSRIVTSKNIKPGTVVILNADYSPNSIALLFALINHNCIIVPLTMGNEEILQQHNVIARGEKIIKVDLLSDQASIFESRYKGDHKLYAELRKNNHAGLVLFSSGSTGKSKAIVHDLSKLLKKYMIKRHDLKTLAFLMFDHIGGLDTLFYTLSNGSCLVTANSRTPDEICQLIENYEVEVLPATPTFLNLLLLSEAYKTYNLSSLKYITYGAEVMPEHTLKQLHEIFPFVNLRQKYGTSEIGTLRSMSKASNSQWVKIGGEGYKIRVVEGMLQIKAESAMLGYLNAPSPFTKDGWFITGDQVETDGEYYRVLGRKSDIINIGGEKVFPVEVENVLMEIPEVADAIVYGEKNAITGMIVCADLIVISHGNPKEFIPYVKDFCRGKLPNYMVPIKIRIRDEDLHTTRHKKVRSNRKDQ